MKNFIEMKENLKILVLRIRIFYIQIFDWSSNLDWVVFCFCHRVTQFQLFLLSRIRFSFFISFCCQKFFFSFFGNISLKSKLYLMIINLIQLEVFSSKFSTLIDSPATMNFQSLFPPFSWRVTKQFYIMNIVYYEINKIIQLFLFFSIWKNIHSSFNKIILFRRKKESKTK